jgi:hypothetical protein
MSQSTNRAIAIEGNTRPLPSPTDADPFDGMLDDLGPLRGDGSCEQREVDGRRNRDPHDEQAVPRALPRGKGVPWQPDALDRLIELAGRLAPEDWIRRLTAPPPR